MQIKTSELTGAALDWAVAKCEGFRCGVITPDMVLKRRAAGLTEDEMAKLQIPTESVLHLLDHDVHAGYSPSTNWAQGGPIIEREAVHLFQQESTSEWTASLPRDTKVGWRILSYGPTPLVAAMRCYVASKLGDTVDIPEELV